MLPGERIDVAVRWNLIFIAREDHKCCPFAGNSRLEIVAERDDFTRNFGVPEAMIAVQQHLIDLVNSAQKHCIDSSVL